MIGSKRPSLMIAFVSAVVLFLVFGGGMMTTWNGRGMMGSTAGDQITLGSYGWMRFPTLITLTIGVWLGWLIFGKK